VWWCGGITAPPIGILRGDCVLRGNPSIDLTDLYFFIHNSPTEAHQRDFLPGFQLTLSRRISSAVIDFKEYQSSPSLLFATIF
jgi:hypothetical protein